MRTLALLLVLLTTPVPAAHAQEVDAPEGSLIASADVSGLSLDHLSPGLRQDITALAGQRLNRDRLSELAARIEGEQPDMVAAVRSVLRPDGEARVVFLVARISEDGDLASNINARYIVESVEIAGVPETHVSQALRNDLQALVGKRLDPDEAERLEERMIAELQGFDVKRRMSRGTEPGRIRLIFDVSKAEPPPWIRFAPSKSKFVYHATQGWSGVLDIPMSGRHNRVTVGLAFDNDDDLIEEYSGFGVRLESRKVATDRLGVSLEIAEWHQTWREATLLALASDPRIPGAYRTRLIVEPLATFAFSPHARVTGGVSISELESLSQSPESQMASAVVASFSYDQRWEPTSELRHDLDASYQWRSGTDALGSDLVYKRHLGRARYQYGKGRSTVTAALSLGHITGQAPLFERFSLGDSSTLRGWNKYDIAPAGGDSMFHQSIEYAYRHFAFFLDTGSVWDSGTDARTRVSTGFGYHGDNAFVTLGFPLNADEVSATFMMGVRF